MADDIVYVIEQTDQFQKFGKTVARKYEFKKKIKRIWLSFKQKILFFDFFKKSWFFPTQVIIVIINASQTPP